MATRLSETSIATEDVVLKAFFTHPEPSKGIVLFAHGSGSGRHSTRNQFVARRLNEAGYATLLADLLTDEEAGDRRKIFDIPLLARRLSSLAEWAESEPTTRDLPMGLFGASTGGGAALVTASDLTNLVYAVVSRGGRPDLAGDRLPYVSAPTLLIVGGNDQTVLELNALASDQLTCPHELAIVPGATHLFEEPGALEAVAQRAVEWFDQYLVRPRPPARYANEARP